MLLMTHGQLFCVDLPQCWLLVAPDRQRLVRRTHMALILLRGGACCSQNKANQHFSIPGGAQQHLRSWPQRQHTAAALQLLTGVPSTASMKFMCKVSSATQHDPAPMLRMCHPPRRGRGHETRGRQRPGSSHCIQGALPSPGRAGGDSRDAVTAGRHNC